MSVTIRRAGKMVRVDRTFYPLGSVMVVSEGKDTFAIRPLVPNDTPVQRFTLSGLDAEFGTWVYSQEASWGYTALMLGRLFSDVPEPEEPAG